MNNEAQFGLRFAIKNTKQVQKALDTINMHMKRIAKVSEQTGKRIDDLTKRIEEAGKNGKRTLSDGEKHANKMSKSLDKVVTKWLSIGGAITLVSRLIRRAFAKVDEITGLNRMAKSAGVLNTKLESLGRTLKKNYGGDASSAAAAYTSIGDIIGAARSGRGISQDVVEAASRYGIALNGGMLTEDQLMTNIARAMQVQRKKGNMYGVRDIASAFGIDEAMMLHLSEKGANWDRGLPGATLSKAQAEAEKARAIQEKFERVLDELTIKVLPLIVKVMEAAMSIINWFQEKFNVPISGKDIAGQQKNLEHAQNYKPTYDQVYAANKSIGMSDNEAKFAAMNAVARGGDSYTVRGRAEADLLKSARDWADYYNNTSGINMTAALNNVQSMLSSVSGANANLVYDRGRLNIIIEDKAGVLRDMYVTAKQDGAMNSYNVNTISN